MLPVAASTHLLTNLTMKIKMNFKTSHLKMITGLLACMLCSTLAAAGAPAYSVLRNFLGTAGDGGRPRGGVLWSDGALYGTTWSGGSNSYGTLFRLGADGTGYAVLKQFSFADGPPSSPLTLSGATLFGMTDKVVFKINTNGSGYEVLRNLDSSAPIGRLAVSGTTLYGVTYVGGSSDLGTVFKLGTNGSGFSILKHFTGTDGANPAAGLVLYGDMLYGTTWAGGISSNTNWPGGTNNLGVVFQVRTDGSGFAVLKHFQGNDGANPRAELLLSGTTLYGTTTSGGTWPPQGTLFQINTQGTDFRVLKYFTGSDGSNPRAPLSAYGLTLYGTTYSGGTNQPQQNGTAFKINADGSGFVMLKSLGGGSLGANPCGALDLSPPGPSGTTLYGTTEWGGASNSGVVFTMSILDPTILNAPQSQAVQVGSTVAFVVEAAGAGTLNYRWFFNGTNVVPGATNPVLQLTNVQLTQAGSYVVVVSNLYGSVMSSPAILTVLGVAPTIVTQPPNRVAWIGFTADFPVGVVGSPPLVYQWFFDDTNLLAEATGSTLQLTGLQSGQAGTYTVVITNTYGAVTSAPARLTFVPQTTVPYCTEAALRLAMAGGGTVTFACDGTITLSNTISVGVDTVIDGSSHQVTISGGNSVRAFYVNGNITFTIMNLTVANGSTGPGDAGVTTDRGKGAGILNNGGTLNLIGAVFVGNRTAGTTGPTTFVTTPEGGAVFNRGGMVNATSCTFSNNAATIYAMESFTFARQALGGAIRNASGWVSLQDCYFSSNSAVGGDAYATVPISTGPGLDGLGGAVHNSGTLTAVRCSFLRNVARGGAGATPTFSCVITPPGNPSPPGTAGGSAAGGAIYNLGMLTLQASTVASNSAAGGAGGRGGNGCGGGFYVTTDGGAGAAGGSGIGGAMFDAGTDDLLNCTFFRNTGTGGTGGAGGAGGRSDHSIGGNGAAGGNGSDGCGGIFGGTRYVTNCTLAFNSGSLGPGGSGGAAGYGGYLNGQPGTNGSNGLAYGALANSGSALVNSLLATNTPGNASGTVQDLGHNLSSDATCAFTGPGSMNNTDPKLSTLANNGGSTLTMALLPGSPAIDAGDTSAAPPTDQRGFPRPAGAAADIGAFEYGSMLPVLAISRTATTGLDITAYGNAGRSCRLLTSTDLLNWVPIATNQIGMDGTLLYHDAYVSGGACRFYRLVMP